MIHEYFNTLADRLRNCKRHSSDTEQLTNVAADMISFLAEMVESGRPVAQSIVSLADVLCEGEKPYPAKAWIDKLDRFEARLAIKQELALIMSDECEGFRYWGGWAKYFEPNLSSKSMDKGFEVLDKASKGDNTDAIEFFRTGHFKQLSKAGRGDDATCIPTEIALKVADLYEKLDKLKEQ